MTDAQIEALADELLRDWPRMESSAVRVAMLERSYEKGEAYFRTRLLALLRKHLQPPQSVAVIEDDGGGEWWDDLDPKDLPRF